VSSALRSLTTLNLGDGGKLTDEGVAAAASLPRLTQLNLRGARAVTDVGVRALASAAAITSLDLSQVRHCVAHGCTHARTAAGSPQVGFSAKDPLLSPGKRLHHQRSSRHAMVPRDPLNSVFLDWGGLQPRPRHLQARSTSHSLCTNMR
jgi:hypothetical protein